ncbi:MAG TPA: hypothetical protein VGB53_00485 [Rubricoccaceae bacterium]|jgi:hypothetical protein
MKRYAYLAALALPLVALPAFSAGVSDDVVTLRVVSTTGEPVAIAGTVIGPAEPTRSPVTRVSGTTPYEVVVLPGDFTAAFWRTGGGAGVNVEVVSGPDTTRLQREPASEHVLVDRRDGSFYMVGGALGR